MKRFATLVIATLLLGWLQLRVSAPGATDGGGGNQGITRTPGQHPREST